MSGVDVYPPALHQRTSGDGPKPKSSAIRREEGGKGAGEEEVPRAANALKG